MKFVLKNSTSMLSFRTLYFALFIYFISICVGDHTGLECTKQTNVCSLSQERSLRFFILGDFGGQEKFPYATRTQLEAAKSVNNASATFRPQFYLGLGDNFYDYGVKSVNDKRFNATFDSVYLYGKYENLPWYITAGNHDYYGNVQAQIDYTKVNPRWIYPSYYYPIHYSFGQSGDNTIVRVDIIMVDTIILCGGTTLGGYNYETKKYVQPSDRPRGAENVTAAEELLSWMDGQLSNSKANFLIVVGHYPIYSTGVHGSTSCLENRFLDILMKNRVNAYFCGHDHKLEHSTISGPDGWLLNHLTSGSASKVDKRSSQQKQLLGKRGNVASTLFTYPTPREDDPKGGYVYAEINQRLAQFDFYRSDGAYLYSFTSKRRQ